MPWEKKNIIVLLLIFLGIVCAEPERHVTVDPAGGLWSAGQPHLPRATGEPHQGQ